MMEKEVIIEKNRIKILNEDLSYVIKFPSTIGVFKNGTEIESGTMVNGKESILWSLKEKGGVPEIDLNTHDKFYGRLSIEYKPKLEALVNLKVREGLIDVDVKLLKSEECEAVTYGQVISLLRSNNVCFGIDEEKIIEVLSKGNINDEIIVRGQLPVHDEADKINVFFEDSKKNVEEDSLSNIDYKKLYTITTVSPGDVIGELKIGAIGKDGTNIFGENIKKQNKRPLKIRVGVGCKVVENKVIATTTGRPSVKKGLFNVFNTYETSKNVDIKSGNVDFAGNVIIRGDIKEGMEVNCGNLLEIYGNVEKSKLISQGDVKIVGNILSTNLVAGCKDLDKELYINNLEKLKGYLEEISVSVKQLKGSSPIFEKKYDGELVKILIETKYRDILRATTMVISVGKAIGADNLKVNEFLTTKIMGMGPLKIKYVDEIYNVISLLEEMLKSNKEEAILPVDVEVNYAQDSEIKSSGSIIIKGKGAYTTDLTARDKIQVITEGSVIRGGTLNAHNLIEVNTVGSKGGVITTLKTSKDGIITAKIAYQNTVFKFEERTYTLETPSKDIKAYLGKSGDIIVEKLLL